jgi:hypothetical protein
MAVCALALLVALLPSLSLSRPLAAQPAPLPDAESFYVETRSNLERSQREQFRFAYKERRTQLHTNPFGRLGTSGETLAYEVTPEQDGAVLLRRLIERDGQPVTGSEVERIERRRGREGRSRPRRSSWEDVVAALQLRIDRREIQDGRHVIVVAFEPRPDARPETREGRLARVFKGQILVDERAREVVRVDATAVDSISFGFGLVARLGEGSTVTLLREPVDGSTWLPASVRFNGDDRALLVRRLRINHVIEWFDYRKVIHSVE